MKAGFLPNSQTKQQQKQSRQDYEDRSLLASLFGSSSADGSCRGSKGPSPKAFLFLAEEFSTSSTILQDWFML